MRAGALDRRITVEVMGPATDDGTRVKPGGWLALGTRAVQVSPLSGGERIAAGENAAFRTFKFRLRRPLSFTLDPVAHRFRYQDVIYDIAEIQQPNRGEIEVIATARAEGAGTGSS